MTVEPFSIMTDVASELSMRATIKPVTDMVLNKVMPSANPYPTPLFKLYREGVELFAGKVLMPVVDSFIPPGPAKWFVSQAATHVLGQVTGRLAEYPILGMKHNSISQS